VARIITIDDAFPEVDRIRDCALRMPLGPMVGPDGVTYENMGFDVPDWLGGALYTKIYQLVGPVTPYVTFFRLSTAATKTPHWAHTDSKLCDAMALLYLSEAPPAYSGTAIVEHLTTGLDRHPETDEEFAVWHRDHSRYDAWRVVEFAQMKYNRLVLIPAYLLHAAMPPNGFGSTVEDGRLVLITFFKELRTCDTSTKSTPA